MISPNIFRPIQLPLIRRRNGCVYPVQHIPPMTKIYAFFRACSCRSLIRKTLASGDISRTIQCVARALLFLMQEPLNQAIDIRRNGRKSQILRQSLMLERFAFSDNRILSKWAICWYGNNWHRTHSCWLCGECAVNRALLGGNPMNLRAPLEKP